MWGVWQSMKQRCQNPNDARYADYGGRGITVCERWMLFENFMADMGPRPFLGASLDRVNNDGPYSPENVRWGNSKQQGNNRRSVHMLTHHGQTMCLTDWAKRLRRNRDVMLRKLKQGVPLEEVLVPSRGVGRHDRVRES
jgi:hypothetical protein